METFHAKNIAARAAERLRDVNTRPLALLHAGVTVTAALVVTLLQYVLAQGIGNTGGLSGMGMRSVLETLQLVLQWANNLLLPFWSLGFLYTALLWARGKRAEKGDLLMGFHRVMPCIGLMVNRALLTIIILIVCVNVGSIFYMMTPAAAQIMELMGDYGSTDAMYTYLYSLNESQILELFRAMIPMLVLCLLLGAALLIPLLYRFRMAEFLILDRKDLRGIGAMILSAALLRRRRWQLFLLDLRFWWYYGLKLLCRGLLYADILLEAVGIVLPLDSGMTYILTCALYFAGVLAVESCFRPRVQTAYACAYEQLQALGTVQKPVQPVKTQDLPWDEE